MRNRRTARRRARSRPARRAHPWARWLVLVLAAAGIAMTYVSMNATRTIRPPQDPAAPAPRAAPVYGYDVVHEYPHDPGAFTQGLLYRDGFLLESTGLYGRSSLRRVELDTGRVVQQRRVDDRYFAEGLTDWEGRLVQLTWQHNVGFVYDLRSFEPRSTFMYPGEGWGLTRDRTRIIMSDGTATLRFLDPASLQETGRLPVVDGASPVGLLNELEFIDGLVYANVWGSDRIAMIDPASGRVSGWLDLSGLLRPSERRGGEDVLNGIAYDGARNRLFVTGKNWPTLFEIRVRRSQAR